jgi:hypothetical protein
MLVLTTSRYCQVLHVAESRVNTQPETSCLVAIAVATQPRLDRAYRLITLEENLRLNAFLIVDTSYMYGSTEPGIKKKYSQVM